MDMIPKKIHYCWFGQGEKSLIFELCLESWKKFLPDYKIFEWNETNFIIDCAFAEDAYQSGRFAFVADYARFKILQEHGGIYLDTDMLFIKLLNQSFLNQSFFIGAESKSIVNASIIASIPNHPVLDFFISHYQSTSFDNNQPTTVPIIITTYFNSLDHFYFDTIIKGKNYIIYPPEYFYALPFPIPKNKTYHDFRTKNSIGVHLWEGSWLTSKNYFKIGDCKKGREKMREENVRFLWINIIFWSLYCNTKNILRPIYLYLFRR